MADNNSQNDKDQFLRDFVLELKELNDIDYIISELSSKTSIAELKQYYLNEFEVAFGKHLLKFIKAFGIGKDFAKKVTDESNS